jgi:hypothetical protein
MDLFVKDFSKTYNENKIKELEDNLKKQNGGKLPDDYKRDEN